MDQSIKDFNFQHFSATSTPMAASTCHYLNKRPFLKEKISSSPASKKAPLTAEGSSNETMPDLFIYDKKSSDEFSFEVKEQESNDLINVIQSSVSTVSESVPTDSPNRLCVISSSLGSKKIPLTTEGPSNDTTPDLYTIESDEFPIEEKGQKSSNGVVNVIQSSVSTVSESVSSNSPNRLCVISSSPDSKKASLTTEGSSNDTTPDLFIYDKKSSDEFSFEVKEQESNDLINVIQSSVSTVSESVSSNSPNRLCVISSSLGSKKIPLTTEGPSNDTTPDLFTIESDEFSFEEKGQKSSNDVVNVIQSSVSTVSESVSSNSPNRLRVISSSPDSKKASLTTEGSSNDTTPDLFTIESDEIPFKEKGQKPIDVIDVMHSCLSTLPENVPTDSPNGLHVDLLAHQKIGLTWLLWREQQMPPSGILADDMGLGKTLAMISLILHKKNERKVNSDAMLRMDKQLRRRYIENDFLTHANSTLVVAPASLIFQWEKEVRDRVKTHFKVHIFHGPKQKRDISVERLIKYDMVLTTYDTLVSELKNQRINLIGADDRDEKRMASALHGKRMSRKFPRAPSSVLAKIAWERIILDEAHEIRNKNSLKFYCCCSLEAVHRWCLTGTPIHNKLWDLYSLIHFLRITPFSEEKMWKEFIMNSSAMSAKRLNVIVKSILLRRTKTQICTETNRPIVDLPPKKYELITLDLQKLEQHCYTIMFEASKQKVRELLREGALGGYGVLRRFKQGSKIRNPFVGGAAHMTVNDNFKAYSCILTLLLRLRQACVHMSLTRNAIDIDAFKEDDGEADVDMDNLGAKVLEMSMAQMSLDEDGFEENGEQGKDDGQQIEQLFKKEHKSTKVSALLERLNGVIENGDKCIIVSQWTSMLNIIEFHLRHQSVSFTSITGEVRTEERQSRVDAFNRVGTGPKVMFLSLTAGGVGLNLTGANHLFLVDLHWNPALELQASDRIHRLGQKKNVFIHKFVCASTIEQRVLQLQEKKNAMAASVLEGAAKKLGKLSKDDVMYLFELEKRPNIQKHDGGQPQKPTTSSQM